MQQLLLCACITARLHLNSTCSCLFETLRCDSYHCSSSSKSSTSKVPKQPLTLLSSGRCPTGILGSSLHQIYAFVCANSLANSIATAVVHQPEHGWVVCKQACVAGGLGLVAHLQPSSACCVQLVTFVL